MNHINDVKGEKKIWLIIAIGHDKFPLSHKLLNDNKISQNDNEIFKKH